MFRTAPHDGIFYGLYIQPEEAGKPQDSEGARPATTATARYTPSITVAAQQDTSLELLYTLVTRVLVRALSTERTRKLSMPPDHEELAAMRISTTVDESMRGVFSIGAIEDALNRPWIHLEIRATRNSCDSIMGEL